MSWACISRSGDLACRRSESSPARRTALEGNGVSMSKRTEQKRRKQEVRKAKKTSRTRKRNKKQRLQIDLLPPLPDRIQMQLEAIDGLVQRGQLGEACEQLKELAQRYPRRQEILGRLLEAAHEAGDIHLGQHACEKLLRLDPDDPELMLMLASLYLLEPWPALTVQAFEQFVDRWPDDPRTEDVRKSLSAMSEGLQEMLSEIGIEGEGAKELAVQHERIQVHLARGEFSKTLQLGQELLRRKPNFVPAMNNMSQAFFLEGRIEEASKISRQVLDVDPANFHAISNLARYLYLSGQTDEAHQRAEELKSVESPNPDIWVKTAEVLCILKDYQGVLDTFERSAPYRDLMSPHCVALLHHYTAVASMRLGDEKRARRLWKKSLKIDPAFDLARENLEDLKNPVSKRHAPWLAGLSTFFAHADLERLMSVAKVAAEDDDRDTVVGRAIRKMLATRPHITPTLRFLLEQGDPDARQFAVMLASLAKTPELLDALRDFSLGQQGPDDMRIDVTQTLSAEDWLPNGPVRIWLKGEWHETMVMGWEISPEPEEHNHLQAVQELAADACEALHQEDGQLAEQLLRKALELEPDSPDLKNNLAMAMEIQGHGELADKLVREIHDTHPEYLFACCSVARMAATEGRLKEAQEMLNPLLARKQLHTSEFSSLATTQIQILCLEEKFDGAESWLGMWEQVAPDHPELDNWRSRINMGQRANSIHKLWKKKRKASGQ